MHNWLTRVLVERLEKRSAAVIDRLNLNRGDWEETFYQFLAANFGFKTNSLPFELMAKSLPQVTLAKKKNNLWKCMRLRPQNFPTIRLAQFAALVMHSNHLFSKVLEIRDVKELRKLFSEITVNPYWENHYRFDMESPPPAKNLGAASIDILLLNTVALFLFSDGKHHQNQHYINRCLKLLEHLPRETNTIISDF